MGSAIKLLALFLELIIRIVANLLVFFGLWVPFLYSFMGLMLYLFLEFNPLDWTLEGQLYVAGLAASLVCSIIITVRNLVLKPAKSVFKGFKEPLWKKEKTQKKDELRSPKTEREALQQGHPAPPPNDIRPQIYYSALEENTLIHEYPDRFEIYRLENNHARIDRIEYKDYDEK